MSSHRTGRTRDTVAIGSNKRPKTEASRRKTSDAEQASTTAQSNIVWRKKSRSPSQGRTRTDPFIANTSSSSSHPTHSVKRKKSNIHLHLMDAVSAEDAPDRGHKMRPTTPLAISAPMKHRTKKENASQAPPSSKDSDTGVYSSALAMAEFERQKDKMKREVEQLKREVHDNKKVIKKQSKKIEELKTENSSGKLARKDQEVELETLKAKTRMADDVISSVESALQCQICMELLMRPYALSPCGHVLCLPCLQEWFRKAPPSADDMDIDPEDYDDPQYIMNRQKSCPCCRATVLHRPVPVFLVKSVAQIMMKAKGPGHTAASPVSRADGSSTVDVDDPWKGLFPDDEDTDDIMEDDEAGYDALAGGLLPAHWMLDALTSDDGYSDSYNSPDDESMDEDDEDNVSDGDSVHSYYTQPMWERPSVYFRGGNRQDPMYIKMIRRGCTREMINAYGMTYTHQEGLVLSVRSLDLNGPRTAFREEDRATMTRIFVGWNVRREDGDRGGHAYVNEILHEIADHPRRFTIVDRLDGGWDVKMLIRVEDIEEMSEDDTSDSDVWHEHDFGRR